MIFFTWLIFVAGKPLSVACSWISSLLAAVSWSEPELRKLRGVEGAKRAGATLGERAGARACEDKAHPRSRDPLRYSG